jgi:hypothetical protein
VRWNRDPRWMAPHVIVTGAALLLLMIVPSTPAVAAISTSGFDCSDSFDSYQASDAQLRACGVRTFPQTSTNKLPDGGTAYHYDVDGYDVSDNVPPVGFDPFQADSAELALVWHPEKRYRRDRC